jgi:hypothetical protein
VQVCGGGECSRCGGRVAHGGREIDVEGLVRDIGVQCLVLFNSFLGGGDDFVVVSLFDGVPEVALWKMYCELPGTKEKRLILDTVRTLFGSGAPVYGGGWPKWS